MARLHGLDPGPVSDAAASAAPDVAWTVAELLAAFRSGAVSADRDDLVDSLDKLTELGPPRGDAVICHGDLHPFNMLAAADDTYLLDWTGALLADPCFDLAFTELIVGHPPLQLPRALGPIGDGDDDVAGHPFTLLAPTAARTLSATTGVEVRAD